MEHWVQKWFSNAWSKRGNSGTFSFYLTQVHNRFMPLSLSPSLPHFLDWTLFVCGIKPSKFCILGLFSSLLSSGLCPLLWGGKCSIRHKAWMQWFNYHAGRCQFKCVVFHYYLWSLLLCFDGVKCLITFASFYISFRTSIIPICTAAWCHVKWNLHVIVCSVVLSLLFSEISL